MFVRNCIYKVDSYLAESRVHHHYFRQDRQRTYNIILWRIHVTIVTAETQQYLHRCSSQQYKSVQCCNGNAKVVPFALSESYKIFRSVFNE